MPPATVEVNGYALREIRVRGGVDIAPMAEQIGVSRSYLTKIELGHNTRVSPGVFNALLQALSLTDRRVLLANPHGNQPLAVAQ
jgi:transcriptional regulator with XRE-family HTH domain